MYGTNMHKYYFYEVKAVFANFLHHHTGISNCQVLFLAVLMMVNHKENQSKIIKSRYKD